MCMSSVSNVIYHKFSHGAAFYTLNGNNVNVMLELGVILELMHYKIPFLCHYKCLILHQISGSAPFWDNVQIFNCIS